MTLKKLPIGIESFEKIRTDDFYYVDKTKMIEKLLDNWGEANLFTRPRRFGKSLNMSMLKSFFEIGTDAHLFDGLYIAQQKEICEKYMGKYPVVSISLKGVNAENYEDAKALLRKVINEEARRLQFLMDSERLTATDKELYRQMLSIQMEEETIVYSIREMTELLCKHYQKRVIVLIDEYDVPLAKANERNYYDQMVLLLRNLFENTLKTNDNLYFAVLTGCLRVAKESIFTGLNNFRVYSLNNTMFDEFFGFTDSEVRQMLAYYGQEQCFDTVKEWYDGYHFGNVDVYCPWDVINYCMERRENHNLQPRNYWLNTSGNDVIRHFVENVENGKKLAKAELERLVNGDSVQKAIQEELTYKELYSSMDNLWSALYMTGYLTEKGESNGNMHNLMIPNLEIRNIITEQILTMFRDKVAEDGKMLEQFCVALENGEPDEVERIFTEYMQKTISVRDTFVRKPTKENFYHGILLGILGYKEGWTVVSNKECGEGFSDILVRMDDSDTGIIIEIKYTEREQMAAECEKALKQIDSRHYTDAFSYEEPEIQTVLKYGISCNRKTCCVRMNREKLEQQM